MREKITHLLLDRWENTMIRRQGSQSQGVCALKKFDRKTAADRRHRVGQSDQEVSDWLKEHLGLGLSLRISWYAGWILFSHFKKYFYIVPTGQVGIFWGIWVDKTFMFLYPPNTQILFLICLKNNSHQCDWRPPPHGWNYYLKYPWEITLWKIQCVS